MESIIKAAVMILLAELGDKTQLLVLSCATKFSPRTVLLSIASSSLVLFGGAVLLGSFAGHLIPNNILQWVVPLIFIGFGIWFILDTSDAAGEKTCETPTSFLTVSGAFILAEMGDKTQLSALSLASEQNQSALFIWIGAVLGMIMADGLALYIGCILKKKLPQRLIKYCAGILFVVYGAFQLIFR